MIKKYKGFTLIELMVVVVILGILAVVVAPRIPDLVKKAKEGATKGSLSTLRSTLNIYYSDTEGFYPATHWNKDAVSDPISPNPNPVLETALVPKYIKAIPMVKLPTAHKDDKNDVYVFKNVPSVASENSVGGGYGWGYGSVYGTETYGHIMVYCEHTDTGGNYWYNY
jgi:type II secretion system protein G